VTNAAEHNAPSCFCGSALQPTGQTDDVAHAAGGWHSDLAGCRRCGAVWILGFNENRFLAAVLCELAPDGSIKVEESIRKLSRAIAAAVGRTFSEEPVHQARIAAAWREEWTRRDGPENRPASPNEHTH
jgi:hypothetical protein